MIQAALASKAIENASPNTMNLAVGIAGAALLGVVGWGIYSLNSITNGVTNAAGSAAEVIGLKDSDADKELQALQAKVEKGSYAAAMNPNTWRPYMNDHVTARFSDKSTNTLAAIIYNAKSYVNDDEDAIYGAIRKCRSRVHISKIADHFFLNYKIDMRSFIEDVLDGPEEMKPIWDHIESIPLRVNL